MKRTLKMIVMLLCVATFATFSSCSKDIDSLNNQNSYPFTLGYYHPEKKVKKITSTYMDDGNPQYVDTCYFTWTGNDLDKITYKRLDFRYYPYYNEVVLDGVDETNEYQVFTYNDLGYIHTIDKYEYSDYSNRYEHIRSDTVRYKKYGDEFAGGTRYYYVWIGDDDYDPYYGWGSGSYIGECYQFNAQGFLEGLSGKSVTLDANGNIILWNNYIEFSYDNKKNPFNNLLSYFDGLYALTYTWNCDLFVCPNNCIVEDNEQSLVYEYSGDYPTTIKWSLDDDQYIIWEIEYFN